MKDFCLVQGDCMTEIPQIEGPVDMIFADPPYSLEGLDTLPDRVFSKDILNDGFYFILEHPDSYSFAEHPYFVKEKRYANVHFSFFEKR